MTYGDMLEAWVPFIVFKEVFEEYLALIVHLNRIYFLRYFIHVHLKEESQKFVSAYAHSYFSTVFLFAEILFLIPNPFSLAYVL